MDENKPHNSNNDLSLSGRDRTINVRKDYKGIVLAAGFGTRMLDLTKKQPKPSLPFMGIPLLYWALDRLENTGIREVAVNGHYLPNAIEKLLSDYQGDLNINFSLESPKVLGSAGVYKALKNWRKDYPIIATNSDIIMEGSLDHLFNGFDQSQEIARLLLLNTHRLNTTPVYTKESQIISFSYPPKKNGESHSALSARTFASTQILSEKFLKEVEKQDFSSIVDIYKLVLQRQSLLGFSLQNNPWSNLESPEDLWMAHMKAMSQGSSYHQCISKIGSKSLLARSPQGAVRQYHQETVIGKCKIIPPVYIFGDVSFSGASEIGPYAVIYGPGTVRPGCSIKHSVCHNPNFASGIYQDVWIGPEKIHEIKETNRFSKRIASNRLKKAPITNKMYQI